MYITIKSSYTVLLVVQEPWTAFRRAAVPTALIVPLSKSLVSRWLDSSVAKSQRNTNSIRIKVTFAWASLNAWWIKSFDFIVTLMVYPFTQWPLDSLRVNMEQNRGFPRQKVIYNIPNKIKTEATFACAFSVLALLRQKWPSGYPRRVDCRLECLQTRVCLPKVGSHFSKMGTQ